MILNWAGGTVSPRIQLNANLYYMDYKDQLILTGNINDVGAYIRANVADSYRAGLELDASIQFSDKFSIRPNLALSNNKIKDFVLVRDGVTTNLGDTNIAFSPSIIAGNVISYTPSSGFELALYSKLVGDQYLSNTDTEESKLEGYFTTDFNITYEIRTGRIFKSVVLSGLVNNIFDEQYVSNGYTFLDNFSTPGNSFEVQGFYPQAGINFLVGASFNF